VSVNGSARCSIDDPIAASTAAVIASAFAGGTWFGRRQDVSLFAWNSASRRWPTLIASIATSGAGWLRCGERS